MSFRKLFWAHLFHKDHLWLAVCVVILAGLGIHSYVTNESVGMRFTTVAMPIFLVVLMISNSVFYAVDEISPVSSNRAHVSYWKITWPLYILRSILPMSLLLVLMWQFIKADLRLYFVATTVLAVLANFVWRYWKFSRKSEAASKITQKHNSSN